MRHDWRSPLTTPTPAATISALPVCIYQRRKSFSGSGGVQLFSFSFVHPSLPSTNTPLTKIWGVPGHPGNQGIYTSANHVFKLFSLHQVPKVYGAYGPTDEKLQYATMKFIE